MTCEDAARLLQEYLDRELSNSDVAHVEQHIRDCACCFGHYDFDRILRVTLKKAGLKARLSDDVKRLICEKLGCSAEPPRDS